MIKYFLHREFAKTCSIFMLSARKVQYLIRKDEQSIVFKCFLHREFAKTCRLLLSASESRVEARAAATLCFGIQSIGKFRFNLFLFKVII